MVFVLTESYIEHEVTGRTIPMRRKNGEFVSWLVARPSIFCEGPWTPWKRLDEDRRIGGRREDRIRLSKNIGVPHGGWRELQGRSGGVGSMSVHHTRRPDKFWFQDARRP